MSENKLDKLFQEKLNDFQEVPDERIWRSIEASLDKKQRSRKVIPLWWKLGGIAAVLALLFVAINPFFDSVTLSPIVTDVEIKGVEEVEDAPKNNLNEAVQETPVLTDTQKANKEESILLEVTGKGIKGQQPATNIGVATRSTNIEDPSVFPADGETKEMGVADNQNLVEGNANKEGNRELMDTGNQVPLGEETNGLAEQSQLAKAIDTSQAEVDPKKKSLLDEIEKQAEENAVAGVKGSKWSAGPSVAPVYFNGIGGGSPINSMLASNSKTGSVTISYGVNVAYEVSKKISIRSGIHKVDFGYNTNNVAFTSSFNAPSHAQLENINYTNTAQSIVIRDTRNHLGIQQGGVPVALDVSGKSPSRMGTMGQQIGYVEVPLEVNYTLVDSRFGVNLIGGVSSLFLTDNEVVLQSSGKTTVLGEANNINSVNFSTNIGLGLNYEFNSKLKLNVEPVFKYQLNTFEDTAGSFNPYSLGVYSGFSFKF